jgi:hypothetical protein
LLFAKSLRFDFRTLCKKDGGSQKSTKKADRQSLLQFDAEVEVDREKVAVIAELP